MVTVNGQKMGKSLGNFVTLKDAFTKYNPLTIRFFILTTHYRSPLDFSNEALDAADKGLERLYNTIINLREQIDSAKDGSTPSGIYEKLEHYKKAFLEAMDEDINTPGAIAALFDLSKEVNTLLNSGQEISKKCLEDIDKLYHELAGNILGIIPKIFESEQKGKQTCWIMLCECSSIPAMNCVRQNNGSYQISSVTNLLKSVLPLTINRTAHRGKGQRDEVFL